MRRHWVDRKLADSRVRPHLAALRSGLEAVEINGMVVARHADACDQVPRRYGLSNCKVERMRRRPQSVGYHYPGARAPRPTRLAYSRVTVMDADRVADPPCTHVRQGRGSRTAPPPGFDQHHKRLHSIILSLPRNPIAHSRSRLTATLISVSVRGYVANMAQLRHDVMT